MQLIVQGRNFEVTDRIREYMQKKMAKIDRYLPQSQDVHAEVSYGKTKAAADRYTVQLTTHIDKHIVRAEEATSDVRVSIDTAIDKMMRQMSRFAGRRKKQHKGAPRVAEITAEDIAMAEALASEMSSQEGEDIEDIIRRKELVLEPMDEEEAIEQMELLSHDFFLYLNPQTNNMNVLYRRKDGGYGLLQPYSV